jgi:tetratricopeptide (TPR) repeat protein
LPRFADGSRRRSAAAISRAHPTDGAAFYALGLARFAQGDAAAAVVALARAVDLSPTDADVHYRLGLVLLERPDLPGARGALDAAIELAPGVARYRIALATCLDRMGERRRAIEALREVPRLSPTAEEAAVAIQAARTLSDPFRDLPTEARHDLEAGLGHLANEAPGLALEVLERAVERFPDLAMAHALLGLAAERLDEPGRAVTELRRACELAPLLAQPHAWLGELFESMDRPELAAEQYAAAIQAAPLDVNTLFQLGRLSLDSLGRPAAAIAPLRDAAALSPRDPALQILLARAELRAGARPTGFARLQRLLDGHPDDAEVLLRVAAALSEQRSSSAMADRRELTRRVEALCEKVLDLRPRDVEAARLLAQVRESSDSSRHD